MPSSKFWSTRGRSLVNVFFVNDNPSVKTKCERLFPRKHNVTVQLVNVDCGVIRIFKKRKRKKRKNIYLSMNRMNISAQVYDVNFISNKLLNINMECTVETLHYYLTSRLHLIHYKVNIVYLKIWRT